MCVYAYDILYIGKCHINKLRAASGSIRGDSWYRHEIEVDLSRI